MIENVMLKMVDYFGTDIKRINHAVKVYGYSQLIGKLEKLTNEELCILSLAAILHDIGIKEAERKYNSSAGNYQELEGPPIAQEILNECGISEEIIPRILFLIENHHSYTKIDRRDFQILVEADFIVNIYEDELEVTSVYNIIKKYFKTQSGIHIATAMFNYN